MKKIKLTQGKYTIVDNDDYKNISIFNWSLLNNKYAYRIVKNKGILMHRFIMNAPKGKDVDHINHNGLDNRRCNLRICTHSENLANRTNKEKLKGVYFRPKKNAWVSSIKINNKYVYLGYFKNKIEAAMAYDKKAKEIFGNFASLNFK